MNKAKIIAACMASLANFGQVPYAMQIQARDVLAQRTTTRKNKGPNATKGKRQASLKSRSNKRK